MGSKKMKAHNDRKNEDPSMSSDSNELMDMVFGNHLLREKILEHVIYPSNNTEVNYKDLKNIRLVQKSWLESTSQLLRKNLDPLFNLQTSIINSVAEYLYANECKLLDRFVRTITRHDKIEDSIPTISLELVCGFFIPENHEDLSKFLVLCGSGVTSLQITFPKNCSMSFLFPPFSLPILQQLRVDFVVRTHPVLGVDNEDENNAEFNVLRNNITVPYFLQQIFNSSRELKTVEFAASGAAEFDIIPFGFDLLHLPPSITTLLIKCPVLAKHLDILVRSNEATFPNLTRLEIMASDVPFREDVINWILVRYHDTLKILKLSGMELQFRLDLNPNVNLTLSSLFKIPPMKKLEKLSLSSFRWTGESNFHMNSINFPNFTTLKMKRVTLTLFEQITDKYRMRLQSIKNLKIWLIEEVDDERHFETTLSLNEERMRRAHLVFGYVTNLDITVCGKQICGLKYIFKEMLQLTSLTINVRNWLANLTCAAWDGLFIGAPEWKAQALRDHPEYWGHFTPTNGHQYPSINRLTALSKLTLDSTDMPIKIDLINGGRKDLVSEVSFHYAFVKMPRLKNLSMFGRFRPSEKMINLWKKGNKSAESLFYAEERKK